MGLSRRLMADVAVADFAFYRGNFASTRTHPEPQQGDTVAGRHPICAPRKLGNLFGEFLGPGDVNQCRVLG
jgi:hypothetical protein